MDQGVGHVRIRGFERAPIDRLDGQNTAAHAELFDKTSNRKFPRRAESTSVNSVRVADALIMRVASDSGACFGINAARRRRTRSQIGFEDRTRSRTWHAIAPEELDTQFERVEIVGEWRGIADDLATPNFHGEPER